MREGTLTGLHRHLPSIHDNDVSGTKRLSYLDTQLSCVNFIWISHAHLDHYGDFPIVVHAIANSKQKCKHIIQQSSQLLVIAPPNVLAYLNVILNQTTSNNGSRQQYASGFTQGILYSQLYKISCKKLMLFTRHLIYSITVYTLPLPILGVHQHIQFKSYHSFESLQNV